MRFVTMSLAALVVAAAASPAFGQTEIARRTAVSFGAGVGSAASTTGISLGGSVLFDLNDRVALEGQGTYLDRGRGADAFSASGSLLLNLVSSRQRVVPYAAVGGGLYRASFDLASPRFFGPMHDEFAPGSIVCPEPGIGMGPGPGFGFGPGSAVCPADAAGHWGVGEMGNFYARRMGPMMVPAGGAWDNRSFSDPAVSVGGGVRFNINEHVMIRPEIRALTVFADGDTHSLAVFGFNVGYRF